MRQQGTDEMREFVCADFMNCCALPAWRHSITGALGSGDKWQDVPSTALTIGNLYDVWRSRAGELATDSANKETEK
jgi:hypothetical protein